MTSGQMRQGLPLLTIWLKPRVTIERVLASYSTRWILVLAALNAIFGFLNGMIAKGHMGSGPPNLRLLACIALGAGALGIGSLYLAGLFFKWSGRLFRGHASAAELRAVIAWGGVPTVMGLAAVFVVLTGLYLAGARSPGTQAVEVTLQVIAGVLGLWSLVVLLLMLSRVQKFGFWRTIASAAIAYILLVSIPLLIRTFAFEPFNSPSGSMAPTLVVGDYFFVSKYRYGYSRYSLPFSPALFAGRIIGREPERGDVVVFRQLRNPSVDFVKRIVGLPGDSVQVSAGVLQINGQSVLRDPLGDFLDAESMLRVKRWRETLPNGVSYEVLDDGKGFLENTGVYVVPAGRYFMMGDHRENSADSRLPESQGGGSVPYENLVGRVEIIFYSHGASVGVREDVVRFDRIGTAVH
jgi:signal peptidase I